MFYKILLTGLVLVGLTYAEMKQACEVVYQGDLNGLNDSSVVVPELAVALSGIIKVLSISDSINGTGEQPSIFFVIDESATMFGTDRIGLRYSTTAWFVDTVMKLYPSAEVGLAMFAEHLWLDPNDNNLFVKCPAYTFGGYLPLLKLNQSYGGMTGQQIIKKYIAIDTLTVTPPWGRIIYEPSSFDAGIYTNINVGITSAKHAFANASYKKRERHFLIYLSDGGANEANGPETNVNAYVTNVDSLPTTFTIFFVEEGTGNVAPPDMVKFTNNVKVNGYSTINQKSNIWSIKSDTLKQLLINNVMTIVLGDLSMNPDSISLNGLLNHTYDTINHVFNFVDPFPLLGVTTPFNFGINYTIYKDSIDTASGDTIHDTTFIEKNGDFSVKIQNGVSLPVHYPDTFRLDCWEREIVFYYNNNPINLADETMNTIQVKFNYDPGIAKYNYTNASLELTNSSATDRDKETIALSKSGNTFTGTFTRALLANGVSPTQGNGVLQHYQTDNIVATFRNNEKPKLPLDTLRVQIPFKFGGAIVVDSGFYFDKNADGYVDSIMVSATSNIAGGLTNAYVKEIMDSALTLPAFRNFTKNSYSITAGGFYIKVSEDQAHTPVTYTTANDKLTVKERLLNAGGILASGTPPIYDRIAPIIHWAAKSALLRDYKVASKSDTLGVKFSEPVKIVSSDEPFYFLNRVNNTNYVVKLSAAGKPNPDSLVFKVVSVTGVASMLDGDSLWIHETNRVADTVGNFQNNTKNLKRRLYVEELYGPVTIECGYYFDYNADGYVDSIYVKATTEIDGGLSTNHVAEIVGKAITLPSFRGLTVNSSGVTSGGFYLKVTENKGHNPYTYITADDKFVVAKIILAAGGEVSAGTYPIYDRIAPIIHWAAKSALLRDNKVSSKSDTLGVRFSEPVKIISSDEPFYFLNYTNNNNYVVKLSTAGHPEPDSLVFEVASVTGVASMQDGDSLWIHETDRIADTEGNFQNNTDNTKRRLYVEDIYGPVTIECGYYFDNNADGYVDSIYVKATTEIDGGLTGSHVTEIVDKAIILPAFRKLTVNSSGVVSGGFYIKGTENKGHNPYTYTTPDDKLVIKPLSLTTGGSVTGGILPVYDRVAPIIHWAAKSAYLRDHMDPSKPDTLIIQFSEPVNRVTDDQPFYFLDVDNNAEYSVYLKNAGQPETGWMVFTVTQVSGVDYMEDGDSVWVHEVDRVSDVEGNAQNNNQNIRRRLYVKRIALPYELIPRAISPVNLLDIADVNKVPAEIVTVLEKDGILDNLNLQQTGSGDYCGMIIMIVPDPENIGQFIPDLKVQGTLTMYDAVGNTVVLKEMLAWWDERKSLVWVWNLRNSNGRVVGPGSYVCIFDIEDITESLGHQNNPYKQVKKITIGVK